MVARRSTSPSRRPRLAGMSIPSPADEALVCSARGLPRPPPSGRWSGTIRVCTTPIGARPGWPVPSTGAASVTSWTLAGFLRAVTPVPGSPTLDRDRAARDPVPTSPRPSPGARATAGPAVRRPLGPLEPWPDTVNWQPVSTDLIWVELIRLAIVVAIGLAVTAVGWAFSGPLAVRARRRRRAGARRVAGRRDRPRGPGLGVRRAGERPAGPARAAGPPALHRAVRADAVRRRAAPGRWSAPSTWPPCSCTPRRRRATPGCPGCARRRRPGCGTGSPRSARTGRRGCEHPRGQPPTAPRAAPMSDGPAEPSTVPPTGPTPPGPMLPAGAAPLAVPAAPAAAGAPARGRHHRAAARASPGSDCTRSARCCTAPSPWSW